MAPLELSWPLAGDLRRLHLGTEPIPFLHFSITGTDQPMGTKGETRSDSYGAIVAGKEKSGTAVMPLTFLALRSP